MVIPSTALLTCTQGCKRWQICMCEDCYQHQEEHMDLVSLIMFSQTNQSHWLFFKSYFVSGNYRLCYMHLSCRFIVRIIMVIIIIIIIIIDHNDLVNSMSCLQPVSGPINGARPPTVLQLYIVITVIKIIIIVVIIIVIIIVIIVIFVIIIVVTVKAS